AEGRPRTAARPHGRAHSRPPERVPPRRPGVHRRARRVLLGPLRGHAGRDERRLHPRAHSSGADDRRTAPRARIGARDADPRSLAVRCLVPPGTGRHVPARLRRGVRGRGDARRAARELTRGETSMDFEIPAAIRTYLRELDDFIQREVKPLEREHMQYFDHRREWARTDWERGGVPRREWEELLGEVRRRADAAGHLRFALPRALGGRDGSNLAMAIIREHLARKGLGLHNDLQNEFSIVGNFPTVIMMWRFGTAAQKA